MEPIVNGLEQQYDDQIDFIYLDVDDPGTQQIKLDLGYRYQPYYVLLDDDGEIISRWAGYNSPNVFEEAFAALPAGN